MASRRRRRKTIGKVVSDVERRVRVVEKRPGAKRLKRNVVTTEKIQYRSIVAKNITTDGVTPNEVSFGTTTVSTTEPTDYLKDGTLWVNPSDGSAAAYNKTNEEFVPVTDAAAYSLASGKNTIYYASSAPTGGTYSVDDTWFDTDDGYKMYTWTGSAWSGFELGNSALASISATKISAGSLAANVILTSSITAGQISAGTINAAIEMTSATITGGTIRTASSGSRIEIKSSASNRIDFYGSSTSFGAISVNDHRLFMYAPGSSYGAGAYMTMYSDEYSSSPNGFNIFGGTNNTSNIRMSGTSIVIERDSGTHTITLDSNSVRVGGTAGESNSALRNIRISTSAPASGSDSSTYPNGSVLLVREA